MIRLAISVEGRTEEEFVNGVLAEHLRVRQVEATPILVGRAFGNTGGGNVSVQRLAADTLGIARECGLNSRSWPG